MRKLLVIAVLLVLATAACNGDGKETEPSKTPASSSSQSGEELVVPAGTYGFDAYGVVATLEPKGDGWTLKVENKSGTRLDAPGIYALDARTGEQFDATLDGAKPMEDGFSETLDVTWPEGFDDKQIGMVILTIGDSNYGGFIRG